MFYTEQEMKFSPLPIEQTPLNDLQRYFTMSDTTYEFHDFLSDEVAGIISDKYGDWYALYDSRVGDGWGQRRSPLAHINNRCLPESSGPSWHPNPNWQGPDNRKSNTLPDWPEGLDEKWNYIACDYTGHSYLFHEKPEVRGEYWLLQGAQRRCHGSKYDRIWPDSLPWDERIICRQAETPVEET